jgi:dTDP-4-dehydrorhamnose 3,5-epimerase
MQFRHGSLGGVVVIDPVRIADERGAFARIWCKQEFEAAGLSSIVVQCNVSTNVRRGTLRGMHYQADPHGEVKVVRCTSGAVFDVVVDLRPASPTYLRWEGFELTAAGGRALYIPEGLAHGFQTLTDDATVEYQMSEYHAPAFARGVRFDDPVFDIRWPLPVSVVAPRDRSYPDFVP